MNNWVIFVTVWIILQAATKAASEPKLSKLKGLSDVQTWWNTFSRVIWGGLMIFSLYMAGLYD